MFDGPRLPEPTDVAGDVAGDAEIWRRSKCGGGFQIRLPYPKSQNSPSESDVAVEDISTQSTLMKTLADRVPATGSLSDNKFLVSLVSQGRWMHANAIAVHSALRAWPQVLEGYCCRRF